jgi:tRNA(Arg) A34 adenosine deaminase TadA
MRMRRTKSDKYLELALEEARVNPVDDLQKMSAIIYRGNQIISIGLNGRKTDPLQKKYARNHKSIAIHAEISAIKNALKKYPVSSLDGCSMAVARVFRDGSPALAKPCKGCARAIAAFGLSRIVWTDHNA